jgi:error-prone DNA polymerase
MIYAEPVAASNFSFLRGASHPGDLVTRATELGMNGIGVADRNTVAGAVRAYVPIKDARAEYARKNNGAALPFTLMIGARLVFEDGTPDIVAYPEDREGWGRLCRLLTDGNLRAEKGRCRLYFEDLLADTRKLLLIVMPPKRLEDMEPALERLSDVARGSLWLGASMHRQGADRRRLFRL